ncbi:unnamed protein product [Diamesa serratosioi]
MSNSDYSFEAVLIKQETADEYSLPSELIDGDGVSPIDFFRTVDTIPPPPPPSIIPPSGQPRISIRKSIYNQNQQPLPPPSIIPPSRQPSISIRTPLFEQKQPVQQHRTIKRSQSSNQREADIRNNGYISNWNLARPHEEPNSSKKPRYENRNPIVNNRQEYSNNDNIQRDINQTPRINRNAAPPVRLNDPRINRRIENGSNSFNTIPTQVVPLSNSTLQEQARMQGILHRCINALEIIRNLKKAETSPVIMFTFSDLNQQPTSEQAKKSPLILNSKNVAYMLQASADSSDECRTAMLSRQFKNISFQLQSTLRVFGADINKISSSVANAGLKRQEEESRNESTVIVYDSSKKTRAYGTQTENDNFEDRETPKTYENVETSCNIVVPNADKSVQTVVNTDGFSFSIESLMLLTPAQRQKLQEFKQLMNMSDDGKIVSIRERQQHRRVNAMIYGREQVSDQYMNPPPSSSRVSFGPPI